MIYERHQYLPSSSDAQRLAANLAQAYDFWLDARQTLQKLPSSMYWAERASGQYLYIKQNGTDNGTSIGPRNTESQTQFDHFVEEKKQAQERAASADALIQTRAALYRRLRMPTLPDKQAEILRKLDIEGLLGTDLMVVGTNAFFSLRKGRECGKTCPLTVPDPRFMGLHKLWLADKPERNPVKKDKDRTQGNVLLDAVRHFMQTSHSLNVNFLFSMPEELRPLFDGWCAKRGFIPDF